MASEFEKVERYLKAQMAMMLPKEQPTESPTAPQPQPFVTISRQAGAGGHSLATALMENFATQTDRAVFGGWKIFDQELCEIVASDQRFTSQLQPLINEEYRSATSELVHQLLRPGIDQDAVMNRVFSVVRALAVMGKAIILGRAGSVVARDLELGVSVRLIAPEDSRLSRLETVFGVSRDEARATANKLDVQRGRLLRAHFDADIEDPRGYDATFNTDNLGFDEIAEAIAGIITHKTRQAAQIPSTQAG